VLAASLAQEDIAALLGICTLQPLDWGFLGALEFSKEYAAQCTLSGNSAMNDILSSLQQW